MTRSMVVELWSRTAGVVGIYRVSQRRSAIPAGGCDDAMVLLDALNHIEAAIAATEGGE